MDVRDDGTAQGTFLLNSGDYRYLAGRLDGDRLRLSRFDGAHAFLFDARLGTDPALQGEFWEADLFHESWSARPDADAALPDPFGLLSWSGPVDLAALSLTDPTGRSRSLAEPEFRGKGLIIEILGTWCPNCQDASAVLTDLRERYHDQGLKVVAVAFEMTEDFERNAEQVILYSERHEIDYPVLLATGEAGSSPSRLFPTIHGNFGFPTLLFLHPDGNVFRTHTGFAGPATGDAHVQLRRKLESVVQQLLDGLPRTVGEP
jgi:thiol-disulfide isomerase/thioredoxin